jgi:hypothetical protein
LLKAKKTALAEVEYGKLIKHNPENVDYLEGLRQARGLDPSTDMERLLRLYRELSIKHPKSLAIQQIPLKFTSGAVFEDMAKDYLLSNFRKGVPSLFVSLRHLLYSDPSKVSCINRVVSTMIQQLEGTGKLEGESEKEPPTTLLWAYYFMAQHEDYHRSSHSALAYITKALTHSPTLVELLMVKSKIYKHAGALQKASQVMNEAREMDLQDRFVNSKCVKYMLRAGKIKEAEEIICLFTRVGFSCVL